MALFQSSFLTPVPTLNHVTGTQLQAIDSVLFLSLTPPYWQYTHIDTIIESLFSQTPAAQIFHTVCYEEKKTNLCKKAGSEAYSKPPPLFQYSNITDKEERADFFNFLLRMKLKSAALPETVSFTKSGKKLRNHQA